MEKLDLRPRGDSGFYSPPGADTAIYPSHVQPYEFVRRPLLNRRSGRFDGGGGACVCVYTQRTTLLQRLLWLVFAHPSHPDELGTGPFFRIPTPTTLADSPTKFHAHRRSFTDPAPARRGASVNFSTCTFRQGPCHRRRESGIFLIDRNMAFRYTPALRRVGF